tara:strand:+ start:76 stop:198 length:123 start_codon:yes stop_codon:yes gene_type:complete
LLVLVVLVVVAQEMVKQVLVVLVDLDLQVVLRFLMVQLIQ